MLFVWDAVNREHIARHHVSPEEAEEVCDGARPPFPRAIGEGKYMVWGRTAGGRLLQVIFVYGNLEEVEYESLSSLEWASVQANRIIQLRRIIHAMDLTERQKRQLRRQRRSS